MRHSIVAALLALFILSVPSSAVLPFEAGGQDLKADLERELARLGEWMLERERDGVNALADPEFERRLAQVFAGLGSAWPKGKAAWLADFEPLFRQYNRRALPLIQLSRQPEATATSWTRLHGLRNGLLAYRAKRGRFPFEREGLESLLLKDESGGPYVKAQQLEDPWGRKFEYWNFGGDSFVLRSLGPDHRSDTQDDLLCDEFGLHNQAPANSTKMVTCGIPKLSLQEDKTWVKLEIIKRNLHWSPERTSETKFAPVGDSAVQLTLDYFDGAATLVVGDDGWVPFEINGGILAEILELGQEGVTLRFEVVDSGAAPAAMFFGLDWTLDKIERSLDGAYEEQLAYWRELQARMPDTPEGDNVREGIALRIQLLGARQNLADQEANLRAQIESNGWLDPATAEARRACMLLQTQLGDALFAAGETAAAARAFGHAARHASDNDDLDSLESLIGKQLEARGQEE